MIDITKISTLSKLNNTEIPKDYDLSIYSLAELIRKSKEDEAGALILAYKTGFLSGVAYDAETQEKERLEKKIEEMKLH